jgi:arginyl-tRNA synthetase
MAVKVLAELDVSALCEPPQIAGPGFLNFRLKPAAVSEAATALALGRAPLCEQVPDSKTVLVDFSSPNVAKAMHVGHIRSTILGDCLARVFRLLGHRVITDNHIGDWGTAFGKLIVGWKSLLHAEVLKTDPIGELDRIYKAINAECEANPTRLDEARSELVKLQNHDPENLRIWEEMIRLSRENFEQIYARLGVKFDHTLGESFYNPFLKDVVADLVRADIAKESEGALVVFFEDNPELKGTPVIVQKKDGAANYTTTDLATLQYRMKTWKPDEIIYVTDGRQQLHFKQFFAIWRRWQPSVQVDLRHIWFGMVLGPDKKPLTSRNMPSEAARKQTEEGGGDSIKLSDLLDEAEERVYKVVAEKSPGMDEGTKREIARVVGLGAIKYFDLLPNRQTDYVFSWDKMLALSGNTAPYLQYAYTRIQSILRKSGETPAGAPVVVEAESELTLAKHLLNFSISVEAVANECRPNLLCNYLYELAGHFTGFYENCSVLKAEPHQRASRLALCALTASILKQGLEVLGIEVTDVM